jgi:hypothetical protein
MVDNDDYVFTTFDNNAIIRVTQTGKLLELPPSYTLDSQGPYFQEDYVQAGYARKGGAIEQVKIVETGQRFLVRQETDVVTITYFAEDYTCQDSYFDAPEVFTCDPTQYAADEVAVEPIDTLVIDFIPRAPRNITGAAATITFKTGLIYHADGAFKDSSGFLSDINYLQDNYYYQPYSYVIRTQQPQYVWKELFEKSNHPAGFKLFTELQFFDSASTTVTVADNLNVISFRLDDIVVVDDTPIKQIYKVLSDEYFDEDYVCQDEYFSIEGQTCMASDYATDAIRLLDNLGFTYPVSLNDDISIDDNVVSNVGLHKNEQVSITDTTEKIVEKTITDPYFAENYVEIGYAVESDIVYIYDEIT